MKQSVYMAVGETGLLITKDLEQQVTDIFSETKCFIGEHPIYPCFIPSAMSYSFYWPDLGTYGIPESRELSFNAADIVNFQLAGYFQDHPSKPLYYIRRDTDHAYLSLTLGGPAYTENHFSAYQQWLVCKMGTNKYCLMLPGVPGSFIIRPFKERKKCYLSVVRSKDVTQVASVAIYMKEMTL